MTGSFSLFFLISIFFGMVFGMVSCVFFIGIIRYLNVKEDKWLNLRPYINQYLKSYRDLTKKNNDKIGSLYYLFYVSSILMILFFFLSLLFKIANIST